MSRNSYVLVWTDEDIYVSKKICKELRKYFDHKIIKAISQPIDILKYPSVPTFTCAIILIVTDVAKLSENNKLRKRIQQNLVKFVDRGGGLIGTHDIVYRRVRNEMLEKAFGCRLTNFERCKNGIVKYKKNTNYLNHRIASSLPDEFELTDNEICWGNWSADTSVIFFLGRGLSKTTSSY